MVLLFFWPMLMMILIFYLALNLFGLTEEPCPAKATPPEAERPATCFLHWSSFVLS